MTVQLCRTQNVKELTIPVEAPGEVQPDHHVLFAVVADEALSTLHEDGGTLSSMSVQVTRLKHVPTHAERRLWQAHAELIAV